MDPSFMTLYSLPSPCAPHEMMTSLPEVTVREPVAVVMPVFGIVTLRIGVGGCVVPGDKQYHMSEHMWM